MCTHGGRAGGAPGADAPHPCHRPAKRSSRIRKNGNFWEEKKGPETRFPRRICVALKHLFLGVYQDAGEKPCWLVLGASLDWTLPIGSDDGMWAFAPHLVMPSKASYRLGGGHGRRGEGGVWELAIHLPHPHPCMYTVKCSRRWGGKRFVCCPWMYLTLKGNLSYSELPIILLSDAYAFLSASPFEGYVRNCDPNYSLAWIVSPCGSPDPSFNSFLLLPLYSLVFSPPPRDVWNPDTAVWVRLLSCLKGGETSATQISWMISVAFSSPHKHFEWKEYIFSISWTRCLCHQPIHGLAAGEARPQADLHQIKLLGLS